MAKGIDSEQAVREKQVIYQSEFELDFLSGLDFGHTKEFFWFDLFKFSSSNQARSI